MLASLASAVSSSVAHFCGNENDSFQFLSKCFGGILMKRNALQMVLGLAVMAVVLIGFESSASAFGHGSCGSHGGGLFSHSSHGSSGSHGGSFGGLFKHHHGSCGSTGGCEAKCESSCEEKSC